MDTTTASLPAIVLIPGYWLGAWAWDAVVYDLRARGHQVTAVTLPDSTPPTRTAHPNSGEQVQALSSIVAHRRRRPSVVVVAHSGAGFPVSVLLDQDPAVARVVYVDSGPSRDGSAFDDSIPQDVVEVALPPFDHWCQRQPGGPQPRRPRPVPPSGGTPTRSRDAGSGAP